MLGNRHERERASFYRWWAEINAIAEDLRQLSEEQLREQTEKLRAVVRERTGALNTELAELRQTKKHTEETEERNRLAMEIQRVENDLKKELQGVLDEILPEAYATVKEACRRWWHRTSRSPDSR